MLLTHYFAEAELNLTLEVFLREITEFFGGSLVSVMLQGSVIFNDLVPGYGDLDFVAIVADELSDATRQGLVELRKPLRSGHFGIPATMLEGPFLPRKMLDPAVTGKALCWGTGGERLWDENKLGWLVLKVLQERGLVIWGEDVRPEIPAVSWEACAEEVWRAATQHTKPDAPRPDGVYAVYAADWLLTAARLLLWVREGKLSSKSEAADWGFAYAKGEWRKQLLQAKRLRLNPLLAKVNEWHAWTATLAEPNRQAAEEVLQALDEAGFRPPSPGPTGR
jgi:hypothetical protein